MRINWWTRIFDLLSRFQNGGHDARPPVAAAYIYAAAFAGCPLADRARVMSLARCICTTAYTSWSLYIRNCRWGEIITLRLYIIFWLHWSPKCYPTHAPNYFWLKKEFCIVTSTDFVATTTQWRHVAVVRFSTPASVTQTCHVCSVVTGQSVIVVWVLTTHYRPTHGRSLSGQYRWCCCCCRMMMMMTMTTMTTATMGPGLRSDNPQADVFAIIYFIFRKQPMAVYTHCNGNWYHQPLIACMQ